MSARSATTFLIDTLDHGRAAPGQLHERKPSLQTRFGAHTSGRGSLLIRSDRSHTSEATDAVNQVWDDKPEGFFVSPLPENGCLSIRLNLLAIDAVALRRSVAVRMTLECECFAEQE